MAHVSRTAAGLVLATSLFTGAAAAPSMAMAGLEPPASTPKADAPQKDMLIFKDGRTVSGTIVSETDTAVKFKGDINGIAFETEYAKSTILKVVHAEKPKGSGDKGAPKGGDAASEPKTSTPKAGDEPGAKPPVQQAAADGEKVRVYTVDLSGEFGEDISQTPIRQAFKDARANKADYIIVTLNNDWGNGGFGQLPNDAAAFDQIFRGNVMEEVFTSELNAWEKPPKLVFWVKQAMGGASMLPFLSETVYFAPEGRMGGIGNLSEILKGVDEVVRQKQISLRLNQVKGWAIVGRHEPRLVDAMAKTEYVLSYTFENGKVKFLEHMPEGPNEYLLTDDGDGPNKDNIQDLARGLGNDVLTLTPEVAKKIGFSQGTMENIDAILFDLGIARNTERVQGRSVQIMDGWKKSLEQSKKRLKELMREYSMIQVNGATFAIRTRERGQQKSKLLDIQSILKQKGEGLSRQWLGQNRIISEEQILTLLTQIELQQAQDK